VADRDIKPEIIAQLRHLYQQMLDGQVRNTAAAARGLLGPAIEAAEWALRSRLRWKEESDMDMAVAVHDEQDDQVEVELPERPRTRADCVDGPRPCPWVSCRYHLLVDVKPSGALLLNVRTPGAHGTKTISRYGLRGYDAEQMADRAAEHLNAMTSTCALDVADEGGASFARIGRLLGLRKQSVQVIQLKAKAKCKCSK
jgi:hypothetical protein